MAREYLILLLLYSPIDFPYGITNVPINSRLRIARMLFLIQFEKRTDLANILKSDLYQFEKTSTGPYCAAIYDDIFFYTGYHDICIEYLRDKGSKVIFSELFKWTSQAGLENKFSIVQSEERLSLTSKGYDAAETLYVQLNSYQKVALATFKARILKRSISALTRYTQCGFSDLQSIWYS